MAAKFTVDTANKLFILRVSFGDEERTIVGGLRGHYTPEELVDKEAIFATNLEPAVLRGVESNGMILAAVSSDRSRIKILVPDEEMDEGTKVS